MNAHRGLSPAQSQRLDAALVLLLAHHVDDASLLPDCLESARAAALGQENL